MKVVAISDTHCRIRKVKVPDGDVLVHAGDLTFDGSVEQIEQELNALGELPHKYKVLIGGNHDWLGEKNPSLMEQLCLERGIIYLKESGVEINGVKFWGSPATPWFYSWAFNYHRGEHIAKIWNQIPEGIDVLVTHGPPMGFLDQVERFDGHPEHVGCEELLKALERIKPSLHVFGHLHFNGGQIDNYGGITLINASVCNEQYKPINKIIVVDYDENLHKVLKTQTY